MYNANGSYTNDQVKSVTTTVGSGALETTRYTYDNNGNITGIYSKVGNEEETTVVTYEYDALNLLVKENNKSYTYDAWGNITSSTGTMATINPIRYRGYYYDDEIEMYYLQSRYYDSTVGRFINSDDASMSLLSALNLMGANIYPTAEDAMDVFRDYCQKFIISDWMGGYGSVSGDSTFQIDYFRVWQKPGCYINYNEYGTSAYNAAKKVQTMDTNLATSDAVYYQPELNGDASYTIFDADASAVNHPTAPQGAIANSVASMEKRNALRIKRTSQYDNICIQFPGDYSSVAQKAKYLRTWVACDEGTSAAVSIKYACNFVTLRLFVPFRHHRFYGFHKIFVARAES